MELTFAPADSRDIQPLLEQNRLLIERYEDPAAIDLPRVLAWTGRKIEKNLSQYRRILLGRTHVGYYRLCPGETETELDDLYIFPEFRGRGIGTAVLNSCIAQSEQPLTLCVFTGNTGAVALYRRMGFETTHHLSHTRCIMRREVL